MEEITTPHLQGENLLTRKTSQENTLFFSL